MDKTPIQLRILGESVAVNLDPHAERMRLDEVLPALNSLQDAFAGVAIRRHGKPVTCVRGCSACCRIQAVPVTPVEAYAMLRLVEGMPEPRRSAVRARFEACVARLREAGLAEGFLDGRRPETMTQAKTEAQRYLDLHLECPFLENNACSIYEARPFTCREYFVTSPKELCAEPIKQPVRTVPAIVQAIEAGRLTAEGFLGHVVFNIPLTLALVYAESHRQELEQSYDGNEVVSSSIGNLFGVAARQGLLR
jgi:Fe-S-cluster containining protein